MHQFMMRKHLFCSGQRARTRAEKERQKWISMNALFFNEAIQVS